jgi:hypothetical protein
VVQTAMVAVRRERKVQRFKSARSAQRFQGLSQVRNGLFAGGRRIRACGSGFQGNVLLYRFRAANWPGTTPGFDDPLPEVADLPWSRSFAAYGTSVISTAARRKKKHRRERQGSKSMGDDYSMQLSRARIPPPPKPRISS